MGAFLEGEWESLCNIFTFDTPDFGAQFLEHPSNNYSSFFTSSINNNNECFSYDPTTSLTPNSIISDLFSDDASDTTSYNNIPSPIPNSYENCQQFPLPNDAFLPMINNISMMDQQKHASFASLLPVEDNGSENLGTSPLNQEVHVKRKYNARKVQVDEHKLKDIPKKKACLSKNNRGKNIIESVTNAQEIESNVSEEGNSDDESKVSIQTNEVDISTSKELMSETSKGKQRASRGTATDPQSLYARKRRMRINERLKILQNLVPNGTKVDISTMLEEAVNYVKFLQLQIQLLSSDDLWMYAPIAYNGVDMNLYKRISPFLLA